MALVTHVHAHILRHWGLICVWTEPELPYSPLISVVTAHSYQVTSLMMLRLKNLSFTECDGYLGDAPGPSFVLRSLSQHLEFHQIQKIKFFNSRKTLTTQMCPIKVQVNHKCRRILAQWIHNNQTILLMTLNNETPSFYNKANPKSINGESHCFNVSVETKVPPCAS